MYGITYLSTKDREMLIVLRDSLMTTTDPDIRKKIDGKISELSKKEKSLNQCSAEECIDLQMQLSQKIQLASSVGKNSMVRSFNQLLISVNERYITAQMETLKAEALKAQEAEEAKRRTELSKILGTKINDPKAKNSGTGTITSKPKNSWSIDFGDSD